MTTNRPRSGSLSSVERALQLLDMLTRNQEPLGVRAVARQLGIAKSQAHRLLQTFYNRGLVEQETELGRYRAGPVLYGLASTLLAGFSLRTAAAPVMQSVLDQVNESIYLSLYSDGEMVMLDRVDSSHPVKYVVDLGIRMSLHAGASGRVILASMEPSVRNRILDQRDLEPYTPTTITDRLALERDLEEIRQRGYAWSMGERFTGAVAVAAAFHDPVRRLSGAMSIICPEQRFRKERLEEWGLLIRSAANQLTQLLGGASGTEMVGGK